MSGENFCFGRFGHFWVKNTLLVVTLFGFRMFLAIFFQTVDNFFVNFCYLSDVYCLEMDNEFFCPDKKSGPFLDPFLVQNLAIFAQKSGFQTFSSKPLIRIVLNLVRNRGQWLRIMEWQCCVWENFCFGHFGHFWVNKYIVCADIYMVCGCFGHFLPNR